MMVGNLYELNIDTYSLTPVIVYSLDKEAITSVYKNISSTQDRVLFLKNTLKCKTVGKRMPTVYYGI